MVWSSGEGRWHQLFFSSRFFLLYRNRVTFSRLLVKKLVAKRMRERRSRKRRRRRRMECVALWSMGSLNELSSHFLLFLLFEFDDYFSSFLSSCLPSSAQSLDQERREEFSMMSSMKWLIAKDETYQITILFKYWFIHGKDDQKGRVLYAKRWQNPIEYNGDCERSKCRVQDKEKMRLVAPIKKWILVASHMDMGRSRMGRSRMSEISP